MDHSVHGYLNRRTTEELEGILQFCLREKGYDHVVQDVLDVLEARYLPGVFPPHIVQIRQQLSESEKQNRQPLKF